jgi:glycerate 2-kinase
MKPAVDAAAPPASGPVELWLVKNHARLLDHGSRTLRAAALAIVEAGIAGGDPARGTRAKVRCEGARLWVDGVNHDLARVRRIWVVGAGKASLAIASALEDILGERVAGGVIVTKKGDGRRLRRVDVIEAGHPVPDADSVRGARQMLAVASAAEAEDIVFAAVNELLLRCGAPIAVINVVRRHVCRIKGGRLVAAIQPARAITLTLNTATPEMPWPDMCLADPTTFADAIQILRDLELWERTPASIRDHLRAGIRRPDMETVKSVEGMNAQMVFVGDPVAVCSAAAEKAAEIGFAPLVLGTFIEGEAREVATAMAGIAREALDRGRPATPPCALISGGESTVTVSGAGGRGGPNQEFAVAFALKMGARGPFACASIDTDGTDGPTDLAGGVVDDRTAASARDAGIQLVEALRRHTSADALERLGDAVVTGHTGTNLQHIRVVVLGGAESPGDAG